MDTVLPRGRGVRGGEGIHWARGLFRLWLVLSLVWAGVILSIERPDRVFQALMADKERAREIAASLEVDMGEIDLNLEVERAAAAARAARDQANPSEDMQATGLGETKETEALRQRAEVLRRAALMRAQVRAQVAVLELEAAFKRERIQATVGLVLLPPAVLLLIVATLLWALRGFRRDS